MLHPLSTIVERGRSGGDVTLLRGMLSCVEGRLSPKHDYLASSVSAFWWFAHDTFPPREDRRLSAVHQVQFAQEIRHMGLDGSFADDESLRDLCIAQPLGD